MGNYGSGEALTKLEMTIDRFWQSWGAKSGFETEKLFAAFWGEAEGHYEDLEYHNFDHAVESLWVVMELADLCEQNGDPVNRKGLIGAALFHDAGYHEDSQKRGYASQEAYSAELFETAAVKHGFNQSEITVGTQAIFATRAGAKPLSREDIIVVRADLDNVGQTYFLSRTMALLNEEKYLKAQSGETFIYAVFATNSVKVLSAYLTNNLKLGDYDTDWSRRAIINLERRVRSVAKSESLTLVKYLEKLGSTAVSELMALALSYDKESD